MSLSSRSGYQAKLREVASLEGHVLLKKLIDAADSKVIGILQAGGDLWKIWSKISKDKDILKKIKITEDIF
ncbi:hypothetical protein Tco_1139225 [Tanacetum coccineum]